MLEKEAQLSAPTSLLSLDCIFISILCRGLKRADRQPHSAKAGGMLHVMDPGSPAALHTGGCAFGKASLRSERTEGGKNTAFTLSIPRKIQDKTLLGAISNYTARPVLATAGMTEQMGQIQEAGEGSE